MTAYMKWNDALARHFFRPEFGGQAVWLFVTDDLIDELGTTIEEGDSSAFVDAVKIGPPWATTGSLCQRALHAYEGWRERGLDCPPYIGYLALFVLAAGLEGDFARHAYYPRLRALLGEEGDRALPSFDRMLELWDDLDRWSARDRNGEVGVFEARIVGGHIHIGLPIAQTILSEEERRALPQVFAEAGLDPTSPPPDDEIARILRAHSATALRPRTRELVRTRRDPETYAVLLDTVVEELAQWDGSYEERAPGDAAATVQRGFGSLRLCVALDRVAGRVSATLRCRVKREFPDGGLLLEARGMGPLACSDSGLPGWSSALADATTEEQFDASTVNWSEGLTLMDERLGWRFSLAKRRVRVLTEGRADGLPNLVEVGQVPRVQPVYLLYQQADWPKLAEWAEHECREFHSYSMSEGMPPGWQLSSCAEVTGDTRVRAAFPELALSERVRLALVGGIRSAPGPNYFLFAPPSVLLEGGDGRETVLCNGRALKPKGTAHSYLLPAGLPKESTITLEAARNGQTLKRLSIYITGDFEWRYATQNQISNEWGRPGDAVGPGVVGALAIGVPSPVDRFERPVMLTPGVDRRARRVLFIGRAPGQIYSWPAETGTADWRPVWALPMGRRGHAVYCGSDIEAAAPARDRRHPDRRRVQMWKSALWHRRKRIMGPELPVLADLWRAYVEVARRV